MKVYVIKQWFDDYYIFEEIKGIFSTREKALEYANKENIKIETMETEKTLWYTLEEYELDYELNEKGEK